MKWATAAGYEITQASERAASPQATNDTRSMIWTNMGETRYFVGVEADGWAIVTESSRMSEEQFIFAGKSMQIVELFFLEKCGLSVRFDRDLPPLKMPQGLSDIADGYRVEARDFRGSENLALIGPGNALLAVSGSGKIAGTAELASLPVSLGTTVDTVMKSYLDPTGAPLFSARDE
ncbi:Imm61 family immunity protein [Mycobacterium sp. NPDC050041]|uniref:Imm61 family immunity protein n=1 Tax=Mycobacterium sp. NPDC050041 TaxID=3364293 RepID=UPI003C2FD5F5